MNLKSLAYDSIHKLDQDLQSAAVRANFDMEDQPDCTLLQPFPQFYEVLIWLGTNVAARWKIADTAALTHQRKHERLARIAIAAGTTAIVMAILQLALQLNQSNQSRQWVADCAQASEIVSAAGACIAVIVGLKAKFNQQWLGQRHIAERFRMLKFKSLGRLELWNGDSDGWKTWTLDQVDQINKLEGADQIERIGKWAGNDDPPYNNSTFTQGIGTGEAARILATYYRHKRLNDQAHYFETKGGIARQHWAVRFHRFQRWMFFGSIGFVLLHFGADVLAKHLEHNPAASCAMEVVALWGLVLAAILPVIGVGVRTYSSAFELSRKARSFAAKQGAMERAAKHMAEHEENLVTVLCQIQHDEELLEQEHREWLRLLLDVEWFL